MLPKQATGMLLVFLSTMCYTTGNLLLSITGDDIPPLQSAFYRYSVQAAISFGWIAIGKRSQIHTTSTWMGSNRNFLKIFLRSVFGIISVAGWFSVIQQIPMADAIAINYLNIPVTTLLAAIFLHEPFRSI